MVMLQFEHKNTTYDFYMMHKMLNATIFLRVISYE